MCVCTGICLPCLRLWLVLNDLGFDGSTVTTIHGQGFDLIGSELFQSWAGWRRDTASASGSALQKAVGADAFGYVVVAAGARADLVKAANDTGSGTQSAGSDETNVTAKETALATLGGVVLVGGQQESLALGGHGEAEGLANAEAVFFGAATHLNVVAINGVVSAATSIDHAVTGAGFFVGHGEKRRVSKNERKRGKGCLCAFETTKIFGK